MMRNSLTPYIQFYTNVQYQHILKEGYAFLVSFIFSNILFEEK